LGRAGLTDFLIFASRPEFMTTIHTTDKTDKQSELNKHYEILKATFDYILTDEERSDWPAHILALKEDAETLYQKGHLSKLIKLLNYMTEKYRETLDVHYALYIQNHTAYETDLFNSFFERIRKIRLKGKISSPSQAYAVQQMIEYLSAQTGKGQEILELESIQAKYC
jgi:hypothetical protein